MEMHYRDGMVVADLSVRALFQGYTNVVHGGIVAGLMDEVMWWAVTVETRRISMTRKIEVEYLASLVCDMPYSVKGRLLEVRHGTFFASGQIENPSGKVAARAKGIFRPAKAVSRDILVGKMNLRRVSPEMRDIFLSLGE